MKGLNLKDFEKLCSVILVGKDSILEIYLKEDLDSLTIIFRWNPISLSTLYDMVGSFKKFDVFRQIDKLVPFEGTHSNLDEENKRFVLKSLKTLIEDFCKNFYSSCNWNLKFEV